MCKERFYDDSSSHQFHALLPSCSIPGADATSKFLIKLDSAVLMLSHAGNEFEEESSEAINDVRI